MKKLITLFLLITTCSFAGQLTHTTAEVESGVLIGKGKAVIENNDSFVVAVSDASASIVVPSDGFDTANTYTTDFTANTNGTFTCNFAGTAVLEIMAVANVVNTNSSILVLRANIDGTGSGVMARDTMGTAGTNRSLSGKRLLTVASNEVVGVEGQIAVTGGDNVNFRAFHATIQRMD